MRRLTVLAILFTTLALAAAACGDGGGSTTAPTEVPEVIAVPGNSELAVGPNRFALALLDRGNTPIVEAAGTSVSLRFTGPSGDAGEGIDARFVWAIPDQVGFWAADIEFGEPGAWNVEATLTQGGETTIVPFTFSVQPESQAPNIGQAAPRTENLTIDDVADIKQISTDPEPDPSFYQMTVAEALETGKPLVIVFATPAFCQTRFCGPILDQVQDLSPEYAEDVNFIHIEPFELDEESKLVTDADGLPVVGGPMLEWNLRTEPWVYIVDADGLVAARFEGAISADELRSAIEETLS